MAAAGRLALAGLRLVGGGAVDLEAEGGRWVSVRPAAAAGGELAWHPGALDPHINGWGGLDFLTHDPAEGAGPLRALCATGTTAFLPTLISAPEAELRAALGRWQRWAAAPTPGAPRLAGLHLEGPFLAPERAGVHPRAALRPPDPDWIEALLDAYPGLIRLVTLAPELPGALEVVRRLRARGVAVGIGHTGAGATAVRAAVAAGARWVTHLFNAMAPFHHRAPGPAGVALVEAGVVCEVIADGHHLAPEALAIAWRCRGPGGIALCSDAVAAEAGRLGG
ncbi:MAG: N-acetylglucosamine-6-phosphate deacetylase, partial [Nitrospirae bacterium]